MGNNLWRLTNHTVFVKSSGPPLKPLSIVGFHDDNSVARTLKMSAYREYLFNSSPLAVHGPVASHGMCENRLVIIEEYNIIIPIEV